MNVLQLNVQDALNNLSASVCHVNVAIEGVSFHHPAVVVVNAFSMKM